LQKDAAGQVEGIEVREDKTSFTFLLVDNEGTTQKVFYNEPVPADFHRSEQVVVIGSYRNKEIFVADKILMKCPSKYQETDVQAAGM
jgi:cytochrome c-type biogenesis protein CcmE